LIDGIEVKNETPISSFMIITEKDKILEDLHDDLQKRDILNNNRQEIYGDKVQNKIKEFINKKRHAKKHEN